jgi:hypothetical protein
VEKCATASWFAARFQWGTHGENSEKMMRKSGGNMKKSWGTIFFFNHKNTSGIPGHFQFQPVSKSFVPNKRLPFSGGCRSGSAPSDTNLGLRWHAASCAVVVLPLPARTTTGRRNG